MDLGPTLDFGGSTGKIAVPGRTTVEHKSMREKQAQRRQMKAKRGALLQCPDDLAVSTRSHGKGGLATARLMTCGMPGNSSGAQGDTQP